MKPEYTNQRMLIANIADRWEKSYRNRGEYQDSPRDAKIWEALNALDLATASVSDVALIIRNDGWTRLICDGCGNDCTEIVTVGETPDYDSSTASLCRTCAIAAVAAFSRRE